jgi:hypothetical protein
MKQSSVAPSAAQPDASHIMQVGLGFWASKTLLSAVKLELFTLLDGQPLPADKIRQQLGLHGQACLDWLDACTRSDFCTVKAKGRCRYANTLETAFTQQKSASLLHRPFLKWPTTGVPFLGEPETGCARETQTKSRIAAWNLFGIYQSPERLRQFTDAMTGIQISSFQAFTAAYNFADHRVMLDVGGSGAALSTVVCRRTRTCGPSATTCRRWRPWPVKTCSATA